MYGLTRNPWNPGRTTGGSRQARHVDIFLDRERDTVQRPERAAGRDLAIGFNRGHPRIVRENFRNWVTNPTRVRLPSWHEV